VVENPIACHGGVVAEANLSCAHEEMSKTKKCQKENE